MDLDDTFRQIVADVTGSDLPCIGTWTRADGHRVSRYELPSGCAAAPNSTREDVRLWLGQEGGTAEVTVRVPADVPSPRQFARIDDASSGDEAVEASWPEGVLESGRAIQSTLRQHLEFINEVYDEARPSTRAWEGRLREITACNVGRLAARWRRIATVDSPPMALVVKLARRLPPVLEAICRKPRRVLRRERVVTPIGQIQEVDTACIRWISQQPGRSLVEKAGHKQQLQSVRRFEDANTLENRVVRDVLVRSLAAGRRYLSDNQRFSGHERILLVRRFVAQCRRLLQDSQVGVVQPLTAAPQPNYVLQYDPAYHRIWTAYQLLLRRERQEDSLWRWRERTWAEMCWIGVLAALDQLCERSPAGRGECYFREDHVAGRFLDKRTTPGDWWFAGNGYKTVLQLVPEFAISDYLGKDSQLNALCPDFLLGLRSTDRRPKPMEYVAFWTLSNLLPQPDLARRLGESVSASLSCLDSEAIVHGCIFVANDAATELSVPSFSTADGRVVTVYLGHDLWNEQPIMERVLLNLLDAPS